MHSMFYKPGSQNGYTEVAPYYKLTQVVLIAGVFQFDPEFVNILRNHVICNAAGKYVVSTIFSSLCQGYLAVDERCKMTVCMVSGH